MSNTTASVSEMCFSARSLAAEPCTHPTTAQKPFLYVGLDKHAPLSAVKLKVSHHKPRLNEWKGEAAERSNYYLLCLCCFHGLFLCADSRADFVRGCTHAERGEQEELSNTAGLYLLLLWLWFNHCRVTLYPDTVKRGRNVLAPSLLMELKAKGVSVQRGGHQFFNARSSCRKPHLTVLTPPAVISKWPNFCVRSQTSVLRAGSYTWQDFHLYWWKVHCFTFLDLTVYFHWPKLEANKAKLVD